MSDILPNPDPAPSPVPDPSPSSANIRCEFCGSRLTSKGEFLELGPKAKKLRDSDDTIERLEKQVSKLESDLATTRAELDAARAATQQQPRKVGLF